MIYFGSFFAGVINGLFASGAGQILVFVLIFILKLDTYKSRATSIFAMGLVTIMTVITYLNQIEVSVTKIIIVTITGIIFGAIGSKIMKKIKAGYLNLISAILVVALALYSLIRG